MLEPYQKLPLTYVQQLQKLKTNGMVIHNEAWALSELEKKGYYRLSAYWYYFRQKDPLGKVLNTFFPETTFEQVIQLYYFDCELRSLILVAMERIEVFLRTKLTYYFSHEYGVFAPYDDSYFHPNFDHSLWLRKLDDEVERSSDQFIEHYKNKYERFPDVPIWMLTEVMSFGSLSFFYQGLINDQHNSIEDKKAIAQHFQAHHKQLADWLHVLTYVRNICAHHGRLWNRSLAIRPPQKNHDAKWKAPITPRSDRIFYVLLILKYLLRPTGYAEAWARQMTQLITPITQSDSWRISMGMPENWQSHPLWDI